MARVVPRRLRTRVVAIVLLAVCTPLLAVAISGLADRAAVDRLKLEALAGLRAVHEVDEMPAAAEDLGARIRVLGLDGSVQHDWNHDFRDRVGMRVTHSVMGAADPWSLERMDLPAEETKSSAWFQDALSGTAQACEQGFHGEVLLCRAAERRGDVVIEVSEASRLALRPFHELRSQVLRLTLMALPFGLLLGLALGWALVRPAETLARELEDRRGEPLEWKRKDEFGAIARAYDRVQEELAARRAAHQAELADLAHELKNPVAALRMAAERLEGEGDLPAKRRARLARAVEAASGRMDHVITQFVALARAESSPLGEPEDVDLFEACRAAADVAAATHPELQVTADGDPCVLRAPPREVEAILTGLVENALSFSPPGGAVQIVCGDNTLVVQDQGPGVPPGDRERIFERFMTTREQAGGSGLGLAIVAQLVARLGGSIAVDDAPGGGARFTVCFQGQ